ncbi:glycosyl hydrolase family 71-domain-containing protein [Mycena rebaudengoi]|nr:glycosyl hydrolase family 71-domain-containing protein [Mycena rebaudengoi]
MNLAKSIGIDGSALSIGKDSYNDQQLGFAYAAAANVFINLDFAYWGGGDISPMATYIQTYATQPGQFMYNGAAFVSNFVGDGFAYRSLESSSGIKLFACPNWQPGSLMNNANPSTRPPAIHVVHGQHPQRGPQPAARRQPRADLDAPELDAHAPPGAHPRAHNGREDLPERGVGDAGARGEEWGRRVKAKMGGRVGREDKCGTRAIRRGGGGRGKKTLTNPHPIPVHPARAPARIARAARDVVRAPTDVIHGTVEELRERDDVGGRDEKRTRHNAPRPLPSNPRKRKSDGAPEIFRGNKKKGTRPQPTKQGMTPQTTRRRTSWPWRRELSRIGCFWDGVFVSIIIGTAWRGKRGEAKAKAITVQRRRTARSEARERSSERRPAARRTTSRSRGKMPPHRSMPPEEACSVAPSSPPAHIAPTRRWLLVPGAQPTRTPKEERRKKGGNKSKKDNTQPALTHRTPLSSTAPEQDVARERGQREAPSADEQDAIAARAVGSPRERTQVARDDPQPRRAGSTWSAVPPKHALRRRAGKVLVEHAAQRGWILQEDVAPWCGILAAVLGYWESRRKPGLGGLLSGVFIPPPFVAPPAARAGARRKPSQA